MQAFQLNPKNAEAISNLSSVSADQGDWTAAANYAGKALKIDSDFAQAYDNRGVAEFYMGRIKESYYDYKKALEIAPNFTPAAEQLKNFVVTRVPATPNP